VKKDAAGQTTTQVAHAADGSGPWSVQIGSYSEKKVAAGLAKNLNDKVCDVYVTVVTVREKNSSEFASANWHSGRRTKRFDNFKNRKKGKLDARLRVHPVSRLLISADKTRRFRFSYALLNS
jgi:hypothetical protein